VRNQYTRLLESASVTRRARTAAILATALALGGCGAAGAPGTPSQRPVPLAAGGHIALRLRRCDRGIHPFCARELVLTAGRTRYHDGAALGAAEGDALRRAGWTASEGEAPTELAAQSRGGRLRLTYATAAGELRAIAAGEAERAPAIVRALRRDRTAGVPALSLLLEVGSG
jgi:hypothetical protein